MQGGIPVVVDGEVVGAIGASFATPDQDVRVAQAGLAALLLVIARPERVYAEEARNRKRVNSMLAILFVLTMACAATWMVRTK